jgi:hypothetical protein
MTDQITLPSPVMDLWRAQQRLRASYAHTRLAFTIDGKLLGDIAEALVAPFYGLTLCAKRTKGVDAHASDGRSVQVKATAKPWSGPSFTPGEGVADHLLFVRIAFETATATIAYNGPEAPVRALLPQTWSGTKTPSLGAVLALNEKVKPNMRLIAAR